MLVTQTNQISSNAEIPETIAQITKEEMTANVGKEVDVQRYSGPKNPNMPGIKVPVLPLYVMSMQIISKSRAHQRDFDFLINVTSKESVQNGMALTVL